MKKKIVIIISVIIAVILLVPIPLKLKDGGSIEFRALLYSVTKYHKLSSSLKYVDGIGIKILGKEIYNNTGDGKVFYTEPEGMEKPNYENCTKYVKTVDNTKMELDIPNGWQYEEFLENDYGKFFLKLYKEDKNKYAEICFYNQPFGVCGTMRINKTITLNNGKEAQIGYYEGEDSWSDISFYSINENIAIINCGINGTEADEVIDIIKTINITTIE